MVTTENRDEYLETIYKLESLPSGATVNRIAAQLGVRPASVSQMLNRLTEAGMVTRARGNRGAVTLTEPGRSAAARVVRRHRLSERFLTDCLKLPWETVHDEACKFEHILSDEVEAGLTSLLGRPPSCPHGHPIPYEDGAAVERFARPLAECEVGKTYTVSYLSDENADFLRYVTKRGLRPGARVYMRGREPFEGPYLIETETGPHALGKAAADRVFVE